MDQPSQPDLQLQQGRTIALCVSLWNHPTTFYAWTWLKQYFLRRSLGGTQEELHPSDTLIIIRVGKHQEDNGRWKMGGPLIADVDTALQNYPHKIFTLQGSIQSQMRNFIEQHHIDVVVLGDEFPQSGFKLTSVTEWVKEKVTCPFIIIRPEAVRNVRMRIGSVGGAGQLGASFTAAAASGSEAAAAGEAAAADAGEGLGPLQRCTSPVPGQQRRGRKICIAYERFDLGGMLMDKAKAVALEPEDTVYVAHVFPSSGGPAQWMHPTQMMKQAGKLARVMTFQRSGSHDADNPVTYDNSIDFGAKELEDYKVVLNVVLRGDPRSALERFCESEGIDLLVIGTRTGGKLRKTLTGGSVSGHLIDKAPCPCLVIPYKPSGVNAESSMSGGEEEEDVRRGASPRSASGPFSFLSATFAGIGGVDAAVQTESTPAAPVAVSVARQFDVGGAAAGEAAAGGEGGVHSTPSDMLAVLRQQLEEKDRTIAELRAQVQSLQLAQAQSREAQTHDPLNVPPNY